MNHPQPPGTPAQNNPPHPPPADASAPTSVATLLFVDDEPNILSSLRRLFRGAGYRILTA